MPIRHLASEWILELIHFSNHALYKQWWAEPTILSPTAHQMGNWCDSRDKMVGSAHHCFYSALFSTMIHKAGNGVFLIGNIYWIA